MELATLITESVKLSDDAHRANNAGHPDEARTALGRMRVMLNDNTELTQRLPDPETEPAPESPAPEHTSDGD